VGSVRSEGARGTPGRVRLKFDRVLSYTAEGINQSRRGGRQRARGERRRPPCRSTRRGGEKITRS